MNQVGINGQYLVVLFIIFVIFIFWSGGSKKTRKVTTTRIVHQRYYSNPRSNSNNLNEPPGKFNLFALTFSVSIMLLICFIALSEWNSAVNDELDESRRGQSWDYAIDDFLFTDADMGFEVGDELPQRMSPNGPWYWIVYAASCFFIMIGINRASNRRRNHGKELEESERNLRPILRRLTMDPNGVIEGRIRLPTAVPISKPSKKEERTIILIYAVSALVLIWTFLSIGSYFNELANQNHRIDSRFTQNKGDVQAFLLISMSLINTISSQIAAKYLFAEYEGEDDSILPPSVRNQQVKVEEERVSKLSSEPATPDDVLKALAREMEAAKAEAAFLRKELDETRDKVKGLEVELDEKKVELESIQEITKSMEKIVEDNKDSGDKALSLQDSVMVGDNLFNGDKIDKQIFNDPVAIAKAAIEAYREGRKDSSKIDLDFD
ncbi:MAG: hypothetical protein DWB99_04650 [Candidatus Poseidoniales archaeon]|nr:MAG: hypothetical protein DWB99_04650 [Candidatus Poseidoniales archaeon]